MRSYEEISADIKSAKSISDVHALRLLADEMQAIGTAEAEASSLSAHGIIALLTSDYSTSLECYRRAFDI